MKKDFRGKYKNILHPYLESYVTYKLGTLYKDVDGVGCAICNFLRSIFGLN